MEKKKPSGTYFIVLDSWRGICAMLVAVHHYFWFSVNGYQSVTIESFFLFVDFFFVLSGFVIALNYQNRISGPGNYVSFMIRRFGRIWPAHAAVMIAFALFIMLLALAGEIPPYTIGALGSTYDLRKFPLVLALTNSLGLYSGGWNLPSWSISAEFISYILFGAAFIFAQRVWITAGLTLAGFLVVLVLKDGNIGITANMGAARGLYGFGIGILTYYLYMRLNRHAGLRDLVARPWFEPFTVLALVLFLNQAVTLEGAPRPAALAAPVVFALVVLVFSLEGGPVSRLLQHAPFRLLGKLSYSIYINHWLIFLALAAAVNAAVPAYRPVTMWGAEYWKLDLTDPLQFWAFLALYLGIVCTVSYVTYHRIEDPCRILFNRLASGLMKRSLA